MQPALENDDIDGVYTDCSCGSARGYRPTAAELAGRQVAFDKALALAKANGKWMSAWVGAAVVGGPRSGGASCSAAMDGIIALGQDRTRGMQLEGGWAKRLQVQKNTVAAFLLARGPSAVIVLPPYDRPMAGSEFVLEGVADANADPGTPTGPAIKVGTGANATYTRHYTKADVTLDCATFTSEIVFK